MYVYMYACPVRMFRYKIYNPSAVYVYIRLIVNQNSPRSYNAAGHGKEQVDTSNSI